MTEEQNKECPACGYPLRKDGFCERCNEKPKFPPPRFRFQEKENISILGTVQAPNTIIVKRHEFINKWKTQVADFDTLWKMSERPVQRILKESSLEDIETLFHFASTTLNQSANITKIVVEKTKLDKYQDESSNTQAFLRVYEGVYFGSVDAVKAALRLIFAIVFLNPTNWKSIIDLLAAGIALSKIVDYFVVLSGRPKIVFEAIYRKCSTLVVVNYPELKNPVSKDGAYGFRGPTTEEIDEMLASTLSTEEIRDSIIELQKKKIIFERNGKWYIRT